MKAIRFTIFMLLAFGFSTFAQQKTAGKATINTPGLTCDACKDRVERALFRQYGISSAKADVKKKTTTVTWVTDRTDIEQIKTMIANAGFDADDITAEETAYKRLPISCRKPVAEKSKK